MVTSYLRSIRALLRLKLNQRHLNHLLSSFDNADGLLEYARKKGYHTYLSYNRSKEAMLNGFKSLYKVLNIDFKNASFLDLGPGYGDSMDLALEMGAKTIEFVDYDPYIVAFNILKGYNGYLLNYLVGKGLTPLYPKKYDIILSKGSINADKFNRKENGFIIFTKWIEQVENLATDNGQIIICPTFDRGEEVYMGSYHVCKDPEAFKKSWFSQVLNDNRYEIRYIENFNNPLRYPFTFHKRMNHV